MVPAAGTKMDTAIQTELADALSATRTLAELAPDLRQEAVEAALRKLKATARRVVSLAKQVREGCRSFLRLPDEAQTQEILTSVLVLLSYNAENLEKVVALGKRVPMISGALSADLSELVQLADEFRDLQETFALALSPTLRDELKKAREQAVRS